MKDLIIQAAGQAAYDYIQQRADVNDPKTIVVSTTSEFNVLREKGRLYHAVVNLRRTNDIGDINRFFIAVHSRLEDHGLFIGCVETYVLRKKRILKKFPPVLNYIYYSFDFLIKRVFPKLRLTRYFHFLLTRGNNRVLSRAETLGRLIACGFSIRDERRVGRFQYFTVEKTGDPLPRPTFNLGILIRLSRVGKNGRIIKVYKIRTMHAYSEFLQEYIFQLSALNDDGKFNNDFRVSTMGAFLRKYFLDELPMLFNWLKGDMKLFGVRPLSEQYYNLYDETLKQRRIKYKPGLIPPYYADLPKTLEEIMESECRYLDAYEKSPFRTDFNYLRKALCNILCGKVRSA